MSGEHIVKIKMHLQPVFCPGSEVTKNDFHHHYLTKFLNCTTYNTFYDPSKVLFKYIIFNNSLKV